MMNRVMNRIGIFAKSYYFYALILIVLFLSLPMAANPNSRSFYLNQFEIQKNELAFRTSSKVRNDYLKSRYLFFWNKFFSWNKAEAVDFEKPATVLAYLFEYFPAYAVIYPTETYYYYQFTTPDEHGADMEISGNIRALDFDKGILHLGYFIKSDPHGAVGYQSFSKTEGVIINRVSDYLYDVTYHDRTIRFKLSDIFNKPPQSQIKFLPEEEFIAHIQDESGIRFFLYYNNEKKSFYYILDEESGVPEKLVEFHDNIFVGERTKYVYYQDANFGRKILFGVYEENIKQNNYFDGPFDQVPPRLSIKTKLEATYPYVKYDQGIDEHGNFLGFQKNSRVAISPYNTYSYLQEVIEYAETCLDKRDDDLWTCLTYESKKDFHKTATFLNANEKSPDSDNLGNHYIYLSQGWPANHQKLYSIGWPLTHRSDQSYSWPPNHNSSLSISK